jgi:hypothetical protein
MSQKNEKVGAALFSALVKTHIFNCDNFSLLMQKYAVPFESRPPRLLQEKEAVEAGLLLCVDNKTRNQLVKQKFIFSVTAQRIDEINRKSSFVLLISRKQCCGSGSESGSGFAGSTCFWASWIRIH